MYAFWKDKKKRLVLGGLLLALIIIGGLAYVQSHSTVSAKTAATATIKTAVVSIGDLTADISGSGSIVAPNSIDLVFSTIGKVEELNVNPGKTVTEGDVLAKLDRISSLELDVENAKLNLAIAQQALDELTTNKEITLANALKERASAAESLETAQKSVVNKYSPRCEKATTELYYFDYMYARSSYLYWYNALIKKNTGYGDMYIQEQMAPFKKKMNQNYANWKYCEGYSDLEIEQSNANLEKAQADCDQAAAYYDSLVRNNGIDPLELAAAQTNLESAKLAYEESIRILNGATLTSPIDGTVLSVALPVGEILDEDTYKEPFIEIADLSKPVLKAQFDESDLAAINMECSVTATFAGLNGRTFPGKIIQIDPVLTQTNSVNSIGTYINIDNSSSSDTMEMPVGLNATVEMTCTIARNVLQVPTTALKNESNGQAQVFIQKTDGTIEDRTVQVGIKSLTAAEIIGDVFEGDLVITSSIN